MLSPHTPERILIFQLSGKVWALDVESVAEIVPMAELFSPPGMPAILAGFLNLAGTAIPVLRLDRLFGMSDIAIGLFTPLLILKSKTAPVALLVERVMEVRSTADSDALPVDPRHSFNGCVRSVMRVADQTIHVLAADRILLEKERGCLADFQALEQKRLHDAELKPSGVGA